MNQTFKNNTESIDTRSQSYQDDYVEMSGLISMRALSSLDDQYQLGPSMLQSPPSLKQIKRNHVFIKMSARVNGEQVSPENLKYKPLFYDNQQSKNFSIFNKNTVDSNITKSKIFEKLLQKQLQIQTLKNQNERLVLVCQNLKGKSGQKRSMKKSDTIFSIHENSLSLRKSIIKKTKQDQQICKLQQIKCTLQKKIVDLTNQLSYKNSSISNIKKQNQKQLTLMYENLHKRLKAKQTEFNLNVKSLKQEKQKSIILQKDLSKALQEKCILSALISENKKQKQRTNTLLKDQQQAMKKYKIILSRLEHCQAQLKLNHQNLNKYKQQSSVLKKQNIRIQQLLKKVKSALHNIIINPNYNNIYNEIVLLSQLLQSEHELYKQKYVSTSELRKQIQFQSMKENNSRKLLGQATQEVMKLKLGFLNQVWSKMKI